MNLCIATPLQHVNLTLDHMPHALFALFTCRLVRTTAHGSQPTLQSHQRMGNNGQPHGSAQIILGDLSGASLALQKALVRVETTKCSRVSEWAFQQNVAWGSLGDAVSWLLPANRLDTSRLGQRQNSGSIQAQRMVWKTSYSSGLEQGLPFRPKIRKALTH